MVLAVVEGFQAEPASAYLSVAAEEEARLQHSDVAKALTESHLMRVQAHLLVRAAHSPVRRHPPLGQATTAQRLPIQDLSASRRTASPSRTDQPQRHPQAHAPVAVRPSPLWTVVCLALTRPSRTYPRSSKADRKLSRWWTSRGLTSCRRKRRS